MTSAYRSILLAASLILGACMPTPAQPQSSPQYPAGYTGMDDVLIPTPAVPVTVQSETYPFNVISSGGVDNRPEITTMVYVTSEFFKTPTSTLAWAEQWITRHSDPKFKFKLLSRTAVESAAVPAVLDEKGKVFSPPYMLTFETHGAEDYPGTMGDHSYRDRYRQIFYFLPVSAQHIFTARVVREVRYFEGYPQFESQYEHFLSTLKRETATPQSTIKGSKPLTRRFYTTYFSFEIYLPEKPKGSNQWPINHSSHRTDLWRTKEGDVAVDYEVVSGYDFDPARENRKLLADAKGMVKNAPGLVRLIAPNESLPNLKYIQVPFADREIYGHMESDAHEVKMELAVAYKTGKQINIVIRSSPAAMNAHEKDVLAWLARFKILQ